MNSNQLPVLAGEIRRAHADVQEAAKTAAERAIYFGRTCIGHVRESSGRWEAFDAAMVALGAFPTEAKAVSAICEAARQRAGAP